MTEPFQRSVRDAKSLRKKRQLLMNQLIQQCIGLCGYTHGDTVFLCCQGKRNQVAIDLPTPVPASTARLRDVAKARFTARAISRCSSRGSYSSYKDPNKPSTEKASEISASVAKERLGGVRYPQEEAPCHGGRIRNISIRAQGSRSLSHCRFTRCAQTVRPLRFPS